MICKLNRAIKYLGAVRGAGTEIDLPAEIISSLPAGTVSFLAPASAPLRSDGPTLEEHLSSGGTPASYPPSGYTETDSPGLRSYRAEQKAAALKDAQSRVAAVVGPGIALRGAERAKAQE